MPTYTTKVAEDGSIVLPVELREKFEIKPGSEVEFFLTLDGHVHFHHLTDRFTDFGLPIAQPSMSIREIDDHIADFLAEKNAPGGGAGLVKKPAAE